MAKKPTRSTRPDRLRPDRAALAQALWGPVDAPAPDYKEQARIALGQRDDALTALTRRANVAQLLKAHDEALRHLEQSLGVLQRLQGEAARRCLQITAALGEEDAL